MKRRIIKNIIATFFLLLAALWITSCGEEPLAPAVPPDVMPEDGYITVRLACAEQSTRTSEPGLEALNENLIQSVTLCLWPRGGDWPDTREPYFMKTYTGLNLQDEAVIRIPLTEDLIAHLFNTDSSKTCNVYAAVNVDPGEADTPAALRNLAIGSSFAGSKVQEAFTMDGSAVAEYVTLMGAHAATAKIDLLRSAAKINLHINVATEVKESPDGTTEHTWIPDLDGMVVMLNNGVMESTLTPDPADVSESALFNTPLDLTYNLTLSDSPADNHPAGVENYPYGMDAPFYTYPNEWDSSDPDSPGRTFMTLRIPWSDDGGASYKTCYYRVPVVAPAFDELVRNTSYHVLLDVSVLGSFVPDEPMPVTDLTYTAAEWGVENLDVEITEPRYLVVNQHDYDVNNLSDISIPFYTSHETIVTDIKMTFYRFNYSDAGLKFPVEVTMQRNELSRQRTGEPVFTYSFDNTTDMLNVSHDLVMYDAYRGTGNGTEVSLTNGDGPTSNRAKYYSTQEIVNRLNNPTTGIQWFKKKLTNGLTEDEFSKVEFEVTVQHKDMYEAGNSSFKETVRINQYPGMYLDAVANDFNINGDNTQISGTGVTAGAFINGNNLDLDNPSLSNPAGDNINGYMTSIGLSSASYLNWNPNLYLVTITRLPSDTEFILADPRASQVNNLLTNASMGTQKTTPWATFNVNGYSQAAPVQAPATDLGGGQQRSLRSYYPTREDADAQNLISPKFRICSSYAGTGAILTRELARRRAATYQENGYPAGRWRLPTFAEVKFVIKLAEEYKIPRLFGTQNNPWNYWCANGKVRGPAKKDASETATYNFMSKTDPANSNTTDRTRFVYDEWYWGGETVNKNTFTWGDVSNN